MRVLVLGGSGSIGRAVLDALVEKGCDVCALSRSGQTAAQVLKAGATPIRGDIRQPEEWTDCLTGVDVVIHAAATWTDDMDVVDQMLVTALLEGLETPDSAKTLIYTGGCWLYGDTGDAIATENSPLHSIPRNMSTINSMKKVLRAPNVRGMVIHPAMVYERAGGVFERMYEDIEELGYVRIFGSHRTRWPLVHKHDLAQLYLLMLQNGDAGDVFNAAAIDGVAVGDIAIAISTSSQSGSVPMVFDISHAISEFGDWAADYALDQQMSGRKARDVLGWAPEHVDVFSDIV